MPWLQRSERIGNSNLLDVSLKLFDGIRLNRGPSTLCGCSFLDSLPLANVLRGNSSLKRIYLGHPFMTNAAKQSFANALGENLGVTHFHLCLVPIDDESWKNMCESLANQHPKLEDLDLTDSNSGGCSAHRTRCLVDLLKGNHVLTEVDSEPYCWASWPVEANTRSTLLLHESADCRMSLQYCC